MLIILMLILISSRTALNVNEAVVILVAVNAVANAS